MMHFSPSGSLSPYYFKGGELQALRYGNYYDHADSLIGMMKQEEDYILQSSNRVRLWIDFYETSLSAHVLDSFSQHIRRLENRIIKLAIVGCSFIDKRRMRKAFQASNTVVLQRIKFFKDPEDAKEWLVQENF